MPSLEAYRAHVVQSLCVPQGCVVVAFLPSNRRRPWSWRLKPWGAA